MFATSSQTVARFVVATVGTAFAASICLLGATAPAHAATLDAARSRTVSYADLKLGTVEGRATLDRRIRNAARAVCSTGATTLSGKAFERRCVDGAIRSAMPKVAAVTSVTAG